MRKYGRIDDAGKLSVLYGSKCSNDEFKVILLQKPKDIGMIGVRDVIVGNTGNVYVREGIQSDLLTLFLVS